MPILRTDIPRQDEPLNGMRQRGMQKEAEERVASEHAVHLLPQEEESKNALQQNQVEEHHQGSREERIELRTVCSEERQCRIVIRMLGMTFALMGCIV